MDQQLQQNLLDIIRNSLPMMIANPPNMKTLITMIVIPIIFAIISHRNKRLTAQTTPAITTWPSGVPNRYTYLVTNLSDKTEIARALNLMMSSNYKCCHTGTNVDEYKLTKMELIKFKISTYSKLINDMKISIPDGLCDELFYMEVNERTSGRYEGGSQMNTYNGDLITYSSSCDVAHQLMKLLHKIGQEIGPRGISYSTSMSPTNYSNSALNIETVVANTKKTFDNLFLTSDNMTKLISVLDDLKYNKVKMEQQSIPMKCVILIEGPAGNGKTSIAIAIAEYMKYALMRVNLNNMYDHHLTQVFNRTKTVYIIDELDKYHFINLPKFIPKLSPKDDDGDRDDSVKGVEFKTKELTVDTWRNILDGNNYLQDCVLVMTTNYKERIDPINIRPGRVDLELHFSNCTTEQFERIYQVHYGKPAPIDFIFPDGSISVSTLIYNYIRQNDPDACIAALRTISQSTIDMN